MNTRQLHAAAVALLVPWFECHGLARLAAGEVAGDRYTLRHVAERVRVAIGNSLLEGCVGRRFPEAFSAPAPTLLQLGLFDEVAA